MPYRFFFSYARESHAASIFDERNWMDELFDDLKNEVAAITGERIADVACRDVERLRIADHWSSKLITEMQDSAVLVAVICPHYLKSLPCGREIELFRRRHELLSNSAAGHECQRILPVFWMGESHCDRHMHPHVRSFFKDLNSTQQGLPQGYPLTGIFHFYAHPSRAERLMFRRYLAERITELSNMPRLPELPDTHNFTDIQSFFAPQKSAGIPRLATGPQGTNVVYAVATEAELADSGLPVPQTYAAKREEWRPFHDRSGTVEVITQRALIAAGQRDTEYCSLGLPESLIASLRQAQQAQSPVLMVLDHSSLRVATIQQRLADYDTFDTLHVGLVTAGGGPDDTPWVRQIFATKSLSMRPHHLWTVPPTADAYERAVIDVVSGLRANLQKVSASVEPLVSSRLPGLTQPGA